MMNDNMYQLNTSAKSSLWGSVAAIIALTMPAAWADGPFVVTTLPAAVVHALPTISVIQNCADVGHGNGSYAPSDSNGAVGKNNIVAVTRAGIGLYDKSTCLLARYTESLESFFGLPPGGFSNESYPRALYDAGSKRFFVTAFSPKNQYFAVSTDETGTRWYEYKLPLTSHYCFRQPFSLLAIPF
jgi:hypothetical protein